MKRRRRTKWFKWGSGQRLKKRAVWVPRQRRTANAKASRALMLIRKFKKQEERKITQNNAETMQIPIGGNWILESMGPLLAQGAAETQRIGKKITVESVFVTGLIKLSALEAVGVSVRVVIGYDKKPSGADPTTTNIFTTDNQLLSTYSTTSASKGRYQILFDKIFSFTSTSTQRYFKFFMKKPIPVHYDTNGGTVADLQKNNFFICAMAEANVAVINVDYSEKFVYTDA